MTKDQQETEAYLARIRRTIAESNRLVEQAELRMQETDRLLASQGLTREKVMNLKFTPQQRAIVNRELEENGLAPLEDEDEDDDGRGWRSEMPSAVPLGAGDIPDDVDARRQKFGMMMKPFVI